MGFDICNTQISPNSICFTGNRSKGTRILDAVDRKSQSALLTTFFSSLLFIYGSKAYSFDIFIPSNILFPFSI